MRIAVAVAVISLALKFGHFGRGDLCADEAVASEALHARADRHATNFAADGVMRAFGIVCLNDRALWLKACIRL